MLQTFLLTTFVFALIREQEASFRKEFARQQRDHSSNY
jgi:hypothetical protein